jgi:threonine aldolase
MKLVDLRSDTVTKPTPAMRRAMAEASVNVSGMGHAADHICARLRDEHGVLCSAFGDSIRMVTHYDISGDDIGTALAAIRQIL